MLKNCPWPDVYWADIPVVDPATEEAHIVSFPFLLPHEVMDHMHSVHADKFQELIVSEQNGSHLLPLVADFAAEMKLPAHKVVPIGLHGDGVPFAAKMRDSLEQFSWNFCTRPSSARVLFTAIPKKFVAGKQTMDAILAVFAWSMQMLAVGTWPARRHTGDAWLPSDKDRRKRAGQQFGFHGCLIQVRGDWAFYKAVFNFPSWAAKSICWRCEANTSDIDFKDFSLTALWRQRRLEGHTFLHKLRGQGLQPSTLFHSPGLKVKHFMIDWLHTVDLGVAQDALGNLFHEVVGLLPGDTRKQRVAALWAKMRAFYKVAKPPSRLNALTETMIKLPGKPARLRSKAGGCKYLIPFGAALAKELSQGGKHRATVYNPMRNLHEVALCVPTMPYDAPRAAAAGRHFCLLFAALEKEALNSGNNRAWRVKPKLHLFAELIEYTAPEAGSPGLFWTYLDESWGGTLANAGARRRGPKFASSSAMNLIRRYRASVKGDSL